MTKFKSKSKQVHTSQAQLKDGDKDWATPLPNKPESAPQLVLF